MKKSILKKYAELIVKCGVNVQKGQDVIINADLDQPEFVKMVVEYCYKNGARKVTVDWSYQPLAKLHNKYCSLKTLSTVDDWVVERWKMRVKTLPATIWLDSEDPDGLKGMNDKKAAQARMASYPIIKPYRDEMENKYQWCIAAVPGKKWAKKVFPDLPAGKAMEKLWEAILKASRVDDNPIKAWEQHNKNLAERCAYLNSLHLKSLTYKSSNGTNFTVGLLDKSLFVGGGETTLGSGVYYNPNIPSEECFTTPRKGDIEGVVYSTKPLSYNGQLIENFYIVFENGKVKEVHAEKGEEVLRQMVSMDEGASMLGEVALIPYDSPISNMNVLFYNTLFDENASCHLALGMGYTNCIDGFENYTMKEMHEMGVNDSMIHVDFMIGSKDLSIVGTTKDGKSVQIFENGNWAF
ncbi:MAG: aminopeptidase [Erysipelotrichales bacterium]|nr:aminopeptidase [Erysipelotrichales bacterium]